MVGLRPCSLCSKYAVRPTGSSTNDVCNACCWKLAIIPVALLLSLLLVSLPLKTGTKTHEGYNVFDAFYKYAFPSVLHEIDVSIVHNGVVCLTQTYVVDKSYASNIYQDLMLRSMYVNIGRGDFDLYYNGTRLDPSYNIGLSDAMQKLNVSHDAKTLVLEVRSKNEKK